MFDVGGGLTIYPSSQLKAYTSLTIYASTTAAFIDEDTFNSKVGGGFNLKAGYDLMLGSVFSIGVSGFFYYSFMNDQPDDYGNQAKINNTVVGLCLTATFGNL